MDRKEAFSNQHSAISENQPQNPLRLTLADSASRCRWVRQDGTTCGSPQMKRHIYCFAHKQLAEAQALALMLPALEDANAIQVGIMRIQKALIEGTISTKTAGLLLCSMQLALQNVGQTTFGQAKAEEPVIETVDAEDALREKVLSSQRSAISQEQNQHQNKKAFTAEDAKEEKGLPRMDADDRGFNGRIRQVEWRPTPDMYRMDTPEGREAYEASLRVRSGAHSRGRLCHTSIAETRNSLLRNERLPKGPQSASGSLDADTGVELVLRTEPYAVLGSPGMRWDTKGGGGDEDCQNW